jgi:hypothetical protein
MNANGECHHLRLTEIDSKSFYDTTVVEMADAFLELVADLKSYRKHILPTARCGWGQGRRAQ